MGSFFILIKKGEAKVSKIKKIGLSLFFVSCLVVLPTEAVFSVETEGTLDFTPYSSGNDLRDPLYPEVKDKTIAVEDFGEPVPVKEGVLSLVYVPVFNFGDEVLVSASNQEVNPKYVGLRQLYSDNPWDPHWGLIIRDQFIQVNDNRGTNSGWSLTIKQEEEFTTADKQNTLTGTTIAFHNIRTNAADTVAYKSPRVKDFTLKKINQEYLLAEAQENEGIGEWFIILGNDEDGSYLERRSNINIALTIPGISKKKSGVNYSTTFVFSLRDTPEN